jgi:hypothetical protein
MVIKFTPAGHYFEGLIVAARQIGLETTKRKISRPARAIPKDTAPLL